MYAGAQTIAWEDHFCADDTHAEDFATVQSQISHSHFGALKVKDAIVDRFRAREGRRPSVEREQPSVRINVYLHRDHATVYLDLSGDSLHRRRYRSQSVAAPLKENVACGALIRALWPEISAQGGTLVDPLCGGGTLHVDGAMMAADIAPGLQREYYGFLAWRARGRRTRPRDLQSAVRRTPRRRRDIDAAVRRARREIEDGIHRLARRRAHRQSRSRQKDGAARAQALHALQRRARMQALVLRRHARVVRHRTAH